MATFLLIITALFLILSLWGFYISIKPPKIVSTISPKDLGLDYQEVSFPAEDNVILRGWLIPARKATTGKTIIALHGYPADKGNVLPAIAFLAQTFNLFLFDFRYLGESSGSYSTVGAKETNDLLGAIAFLKSRGLQEFGVWGFSMGGAVALMAAPKAPEIKAVVSESSYARLDLMAAALFNIPLLKHPLGWLTGVWGRIFLGIDLKDVSPMNAASKLRIPVFIIHSTSDSVISFDHALMLKDSLRHNAKAELWLRDNLRHGELGSDYRTRIGAFFDQHL
jgi:uncharacterized protein